MVLDGEEFEVDVEFENNVEEDKLKVCKNQKGFK